MAVSFTVGPVANLGSMKIVTGTYTSAAGDVSASLAATTHGLNQIFAYQIKPSRLGSEEPLASVSAGTITVTFQDTLGSSGIWMVMGR